MKSLVDLPSDIKNIIFLYLDKNTIRNIYICCKNFYNFFYIYPFKWKSIYFQQYTSKYLNEFSDLYCKKSLLFNHTNYCFKCCNRITDYYYYMILCECVIDNLNEYKYYCYHKRCCTVDNIIENSNISGSIICPICNKLAIYLRLKITS